MLWIGMLLISAVIFGPGFFSPYGGPVFADETNTAARQTIRSGAEIDYPPFSFVDEHGTADGFSVELMRAALAAMGRDVTFRTGPWPEVRGWLEHAEIDALPLVGRTPEREALFDFTVPYMSLHGAIVVPTGESGIRDLADLRGRRVAVMKGDIHLLITDVVMPEMNGRDLAEKLQMEYPKLKVLFMSGYTANVIAHHGVLDTGVHFIQKPFSNTDLAVKVRKALEK